VGKLLTHQIRVETEEENVTVMIGGDGGIPGGFAKFFNRVVDSGAWARLSDAARAAYLPLVRFADQRNHFRVAVGQAALMKYSGLSRSSIKRAVKDLLASKLLVLVEQGGVTRDGQNEANVYQLMVPADPKARLGGPAAAQPLSRPSDSDSSVGPLPNPPGVRQRTPSRLTCEPPAGPAADPERVRRPTHREAHPDRSGGAADGPVFRNSKDIEDNSRLTGDEPAGPPSRAPLDAAALLEEKGVEPSAARQLAAAYPHERIVDVVATMEYRRARGKCDNPGGFIRDALVRQWQTPRAVVEARRQAEARLRQQERERESRSERAAEGARLNDEEGRLQQLIDGLDDDELAILAELVLRKYEGNAAVLQVLTRKPPRDCRLMKMEIAGMLGRTAGAR
jgi:hypothetical protein